MNSQLRPSIVAALLVGLAGFTAAAAAGVAVSGAVVNPAGKPAQDSRVVLVELGRSVFVGSDGAFRFEDVPPGRYHLQAVSRRFGTQVLELDVAAEDVTLRVELGHMAHHEEIVVTTGATRGEAEIFQPVQVLEKSDLSEVLQPSLGETLKAEPGMSSTQYGSGASRPVIRGQGGGRIRVLEGGLDVGDASVTSPDHAVALDPLSTERVEILRGPATLLYGSTAVGGVVNVIDERIPDHVPRRSLGGTVELRGGTAADERSAAAELRGGGGALAWYLNAFEREADDYAIPGRAVTGDPESPSGTLPNSALDNRGATLGAAWIGSTGYVGASARIYDSEYGIPVGEEIRIDMRHLRYDVRGGFDVRFGPFDGIDFRAGVTDYEHAEIEEAAVGTRFFNDTLDGRVEVRHGSGGALRGSAGLQLGRRDLEAQGDEAYLPPSRTDELALFAVEELERGPMVYELGLRLQRQSTGAAGNPDRDFDGASVSGGVAWRPGESYSLSLALARTERFPRAEELYADGPHLATFSWERGDPALDPETSLGLDLSLRKRRGRLTGALTLFANRYADYIFEYPTGELREGLPEFRFVQSDAEFVGAELELSVELAEWGSSHLGLELMGDHVRAELTRSGGESGWSEGDPLPFIPPLRVGAALHYRGARWHASLDVRRYEEQDRVPERPIPPVDPGQQGYFGLTPTAAYTMVDLHVGYRLPTGGGQGQLHEFLLRATNLTDVEARNAVSRLKDLAPLPGRDVGLSYRLVF